ncbi:YczE/YyaS/YitT family protein [Kineothrix sp. MB12-C1]|uniref:YczE/YyaS/YitT family protein n=1 Tax=Kineothrix sp. MB12-C1 TaxID=3070215 RepID=UPI0027D307A9|nr:hypothetical protein [Kineothrix sp. MB12-C1]WMC93906.1 hypothetical protein RBB56_06485 [Kineothrix sp. MB12-C1]
MENRNRRIVMSCVGIIICGISVALFRMAHWGTDPFQTFCAGIQELTGISFGLLYMIINGLMLLVVFLVQRKYIGIATVLNITLLGYVVEWTYGWLQRQYPVESISSKIIFLCLGLLLLCIASSLYFTADLGVSTYDSIALYLSEKKVARFSICRIGTDLFCVITGGLLGAPVGVGTVITAFCMGPLIQFFNKHLAQPILLYQKKKPG